MSKSVSKFGIPNIGPARAKVLRGAGIRDLEEFRSATHEKIASIGNPYITSIWVQDQQVIGKSHNVSALDAAQIRCEQELRQATKVTLGELPVKLAQMDPSTLPPSCAPPEVRVLLTEKQKHDEWVEFIDAELEFTRKTKLENRILTSLNDVTPESAIDWQIIVSPNNVFVGSRSWWKKLFPKQRKKGPSDVFFKAPSDAVGALLHALTQNRPVPKPALIHSIADQLIVMAEEHQMPFLLFLARDYDSYPLPQFQVQQILSLTSTTEKENKDARKYFIGHGIEPLSADLNDYIKELSSEDLASELATLWMQVLRLDESDSMANEKKQAAIKTLGQKTATIASDTWKAQFLDLVKEEAILHRSLNTFNTLMAFRERVPGFNADKKVDAEWAQIILNENVPLRVVKDLGFTFDLTKLEDGLMPLYDKIRANLDSQSSWAEMVKVLGAVDKDPVYKYILKLGALNTEEDRLWAVDTALATKQFNTWTELPDNYKTLFANY